MILLGLDIIVYNFTAYNTYFILLNLLNQKNNSKMIFIGIILDFIVLKTYYKNLLVIILLILINKYLLNFNKKNIVNFLLINIINYSLFIILSNLINLNTAITSISITIVTNFFLNILIWFTYYYKFIINN
jgi:hypothetical protein